MSDETNMCDEQGPEAELFAGGSAKADKAKPTKKPQAIRDVNLAERPAHGRSSPSSLHRRAACPGSYRMELLSPQEDGSSIAAERGTMLHAVMAEGLDNADTDLLNDWDTYCVSFCAKRIAGYKDRLEAPFIVLREHQMDLRWLHPDIDKGTVDLAFVQPMNYAILFDFKFGYGDVEPAVKNLQLHAYAAGIMDEYEIQPENCLIVVLQPALGICDASPVQRELAESIIYIVSAARNPKAKLNATVAGCRYCRAAAMCPKLAESVDVLAELNIKPPETLSHDEIAAALIKGELASIFLNAAKARAFAILSAGGEMPGWKLGVGKGSRAWVDGAIEKLKAQAVALGKSAEALYSAPEPVSIAVLEKAWGKSKPVVEALAPLIEKKEGKPCLERA